MSDAAHIASFTGGPLMTNYFVIGCRQTQEAAVIDAGYDADSILELATSEELNVTKILQTHAHIDHVAALSDMKDKTDAPIFLHPADRPIYDAAPQQGQFFGYTIDPLPPVDEELTDEQEIKVGELTAKVLLLPGHSPGSVVFWFEELGVVFGGDVLFAGSIGRVDLPMSSPDDMRASLKRMKALIPDETQILPGHGPATTMGMEKKRNPFLIQDW